MALVGLFDEMHIFDDSALAIVLQLVFNALLPHEPFPVKFAFTHWVYFTAAIVDGAHDVVQVLISDMCFSALKLFRILIVLRLFKHLVALLLLYDLQLACLLVHHKFLSCKYNPFIWLHRLTVKYFLSHLNWICFLFFIRLHLFP